MNRRLRQLVALLLPAVLLVTNAVTFQHRLEHAVGREVEQTPARHCGHHHSHDHPNAHDHASDRHQHGDPHRHDDHDESHCLICQALASPPCLTGLIEFDFAAEIVATPPRGALSPIEAADPSPFPVRGPPISSGC